MATPDIIIPHARSAFVNDSGRLTQPAYQFLYFLAQRVGGSTTTIISEIVEALYTNTDSRTGALYDLRFRTTELSADYTTSRNEILICTAAITITLNTKAKIGERVYIKRTDGKVLIVGTIDGKTDLTIIQDNASVTLLFTQTGWWIL